MDLQYKCEICEKNFIYNSELRKHLEQFHLVIADPHNTAFWTISPTFGNSNPSYCSESCKWLHLHPNAHFFTAILKDLNKTLKDDIIEKILQKYMYNKFEEWWQEKSHQEESPTPSKTFSTEGHQKENLISLTSWKEQERPLPRLWKESRYSPEDHDKSNKDVSFSNQSHAPKIKSRDSFGNDLEYDEESEDESIDDDCRKRFKSERSSITLAPAKSRTDIPDTHVFYFQSPTPSKTFSTEGHQKENLISLTSWKEQERPLPRLWKESRYSPEDHDKSNKDVSFSNQSHAPKIKSRDSFGNDLEYDEESEDESIDDDCRKRFKSERSSITLAPAKSRTDIPDTHESIISIEKTAKVQAFLENEQKQKMRFKAKMQGRMKQPPRFQRPNQIFNVTQEQPSKQKKKREISGLLKRGTGEYRMRTTLPVTIIDLCDSENEEDDHQELAYVDEERNPVPIKQNNADLYKVADIEPNKLSNYSNPPDEDVVELDLDAELDGFQETSDLLTESPTPSKTFSTEGHQKENLISLTSWKEQERPLPRLWKESRYSPEDHDKSNKDVSFSNQSHAPKIKSRDSFGNDLEYDEESEDESIADHCRKRFKSERSSITLAPFKSRTDIPDTHESIISIEKTAKVQAFLENEQKRKMRFKAKMQGRMKQPPRFQRPNQIFNVTQEQPSKQLSYYCSLYGHSKPITSCCGTENKEIVSCSLDGSVNLWKVLVDVSDAHFTHESSVTGLILSASSDFALSSDGNGNLILWKIDMASPASPLTYAGKKKYDQGFITELAWLKCNKFACAVSQLVESGERNFLDIIEFHDSPQKMALSLELKTHYIFESEISCLDTCDQTGTILVGTISGEVVYITPEAQHCYKMCNNLILALCFYSKYKTSDHFAVSYVDGCVKMYSVQNLLSGKETINPEPLQTYEPPDSSDSSKFTRVMCCAKESVCCGDSNGVLRIYGPSSLKFTKKIHDNLISGIAIIGSYLFTSSFDKTVKGWNLTSFKQVWQFNSTTPVSCLSSIKTDSKVCRQQSDILVFGTTSGNIHILQFPTG